MSKWLTPEEVTQALQGFFLGTAILIGLAVLAWVVITLYG